MDVKITHKDTLAGIKKITIEKTSVISPNILFISKNGIPTFPDADLFLSSSSTGKGNVSLTMDDHLNKEIKSEPQEILIKNPHLYPKDMSIAAQKEKVVTYQIDKKTCCILPGNHAVLNELLPTIQPCLFIIQNAYQLFQNPLDFIEYMTLLHQLKSPNQLIYAPGVAEPRNLSLLVYMGIDVVDTTQALIAARNKQYFLQDGSISINKIALLPCHCPSCQEKYLQPKQLTYQDLFIHNYYKLIDELHIIRHTIYEQQLRNHVSKRAVSSPHLISILRAFEKQAYTLLEEHTPICKDTKIYATSLDALHRPEIKRFQERVMNRFQKPPSTSILLLLPCSAKKPYSFSKSHKKFKQIIQNLPQQYTIHEMIITSPLGLVPRELELCYPAASYDIPVTGDWFEDEIHLIKKQLRNYLQTNDYETILMHLPSQLSEAILDVVPSAQTTKIKESATTNDSLEKLNILLSNATMNTETVSGKKRFHENMLSLAIYQFSKPLAEALLDQTIIKGKYPYLKINDKNHNQLGMLTEKRGLISLTIEGGKRIESFQKYYVKIDDDFNLIGSVFAPGVLDADPAIRSGDEVLVIQNETLKAVGVALMNGKAMKQSSYGKAVNIRHIDS